MKLLKHQRELLKAIKRATGITGKVIRVTGKNHLIVEFRGIRTSLSCSPGDVKTRTATIASIRRRLLERKQQRICENSTSKK